MLTNTEQSEWPKWVRNAADTNLPLPIRHQCFGWLVTRFQDEVFGCAFAITGDRGCAEDTAQEAFLQAWLHLPRLREAQAFPGWLRRIVVNRCRHAARSRSANEVPLEDADQYYTTTANPMNDEDLQAAVVQNAVASLPHAERFAVLLFYVGQHKRDEIAAFMGISPVMVKKRLASARAKLKERLINELDELTYPLPSRDGAFAARVLTFTRLFSALIDEGKSLTVALDALGESADDKTLRTVAQNVSRDVKNGDLLSRSLRQHGVFSPGYLTALREGEALGTLETVLQGLADGTYQTGNVRMLTLNAENARFAAFKDAKRRHHEQVTPEHFLLALLEQNDSGAVRELLQNGVNLPALRAAVQNAVDYLPTGSGEIRSSSELRTIRLRAFEAAEANGTNCVGTRLFLQGLHGTSLAPLLREHGAI